MAFHLWRQFDDPYYAGFAAQIAYFFFMSAIPILIVLTSVLGIFDVSMDFIRDFISTYLSSKMNSFLESLLYTSSSAAISNFFLILLAIWGSSSLAFSLSRLTTYTLSNGRYRFNFFTERIKIIPMTMLFILVVAATLIIYVYGEILTNSIIHSPFLSKLIGLLKTPILAMMFFLTVLMCYYLMPRIRIPLKAILPGSIVATVGIVVVTLFYSIYTMLATNQNLLYGAFATVVAMMLWFYLISWVLCIGMMFNKSWDIILKKGRLTPEKLRKYIIEQYPSNSDEMINKLIIGEFDMSDPSLDSMAVKMSRKFDPGYEAKREREIEEMERERRIRMMIEQEIQTENAAAAAAVVAAEIEEKETVE